MNRTALKKILKNLENGSSSMNEVIKDIIKLETTSNVGTTFNIDFFEFSFLVEACIPPRPIARSMFWQDVIDKHYHTMSDDERSKLFDWISRNSNFQDSLASGIDDVKLFVARFDPDNQYIVTTDHKGEVGDVDCFSMNGKYWIGKNTYIADEFIIKIEKKI